MYLPYLIIFVLINLVQSSEQNVEVACNINVKKSVQCVSDKFIGISVDPAVLIAGVNLSENSLRLAKHINPSFIRIAGPSTQFIKYIDQDDKSDNLLSEDGNNIKISPAVWFGVNEWLKLAKFTPIFGLNDAETARGIWNPKSTLPLFEIAEKLNVSCYWQLGYDSSTKNETRYKQDLNILHYILTAYGARNGTWKIIGSDVSTLPSERIENILIEENDILEAVMWEPKERALDSFPEKDAAYKILQHQSIKPRTKIWTTVPKSSEPVTFASALLWAKQVGNAARVGYDVIFRQPRLYELFTDTPVYWFTLLHKELMGCHVMDTKTSIFQEHTDIFAQCTRKQNSFVRRGALTVLIVNDRSSKYKVKVKLGTSLPDKSMEIQTYILTSNAKNSTNIYLNGKQLKASMLQEKSIFNPKIRRTKTSSHILLALPPESIGFFVIPSARVPVCIEKEIETELLLEEIEENQKNGLSRELELKLGSRASFTQKNPLEEITQKLKNELQSDEKFYKNAPKKIYSKTDIKSNDKTPDHRERKSFIDRVKFNEKHRKVFDFQKKNEGLKKIRFDKAKKVETTPKNLEVTSEEMEKILKDRAVQRAAKKNIVFTDEELEALISKAGKKSRIKRALTPHKRAINMHLLEKYAGNQHHNIEADKNMYAGKHVQNSKHRNKRKSKNHRRAINFDLVDLKAKIAERKRFWQDKKDDLLGNSNSIRDNLRDKIKEIKSKLRIKRDVNLDGLKKKKLIPKKNDPVEATIRKPGQTSEELLEELEKAKALEGTEEVVNINKGEVFAELADSEDLEDDLPLEPSPKPKKLGLFDKKSKIDPFAVAHPSIDVVDPPRRKSKKKKDKEDDKLQFLTTSEEFSDILEDLPSIHEYFGPKTQDKKKDGNKDLKEMNEFYETPSLFKREIRSIPIENNQPKKRETGFKILEIAKFGNDFDPEDIFNDIIFKPLLETPLIKEFFKYELKAINDHKDRKLYEDRNTINKEIVGDQIQSDRKRNKDTEELNSLNESIDLIDNNDINPHDSANEKDIDLHIEDSEIEPSSSTTKETDEESVSGNESEGLSKKVRKKRETSELDDEEIVKQPKKFSRKTKEASKKKQKPDRHNNFAEQMNLIKDKLQERKDEIDKMIKKQKELEQNFKNQWKSKMNKKKPNKEKHKITKKHKKDIEKRSIFNPKPVFGNYQPVSTDLNMWKPSDITSFKKDVRFPRKMLPPNDYPIFNNIFSDHKSYYSKKKRRFIDEDADLLENALNEDINTINKDYDENNFWKQMQVEREINQASTIKEDNIIETPLKEDNNSSSDDKNISTTPLTPSDSLIKDGDYKFKLPNDDEFELLKDGEETELKFVHHINHPDEDVKDFVPIITTRGMKPIEDIKSFLGDVRKFFDKVGKEFKGYFNSLGLKM